MLGMRQRQNNYKKRIAKSATTLTELSLEKRKVKISPKGIIIGVETIEEHIERQQLYAQSERISPKEWRRVYARIQSIESIQKLPLNNDEQLIIRRKFYREVVKHRTYASSDMIESNIGDIKLLPTETIHSVTEAILRYRRLVRYHAEAEKAKVKAEAKRVKAEAIKGRK